VKAHVVAVLTLCACSAWSQTTSTDIVASGLMAPNRVRITQRGNLLISENGSESNGGRISLVTPGGVRRSIIEGLPAGVDNQGDVSGPSDVIWQGRTLYVLIGAGDAEVSGATQGTFTLNPKGVSSPLLSALLSFRISSGELDDIQSPFRLGADQHQAVWDGNRVVLRNEQDQTAEVELVTDIRDMSPDRVSVWRASNPYSLAIRGNNAWIADASMDAILQVDLGSGRQRVVKRFGKVPNTIPVGPPVTDTVPNRLLPWGDGLLVIEMTGFPFAAGNGRIEYLDPRTGEMQPFLNGLTMPIDVATQQTSGPRPRIFTLEFSTAFLNTPPGPGRLMMYDTPEGKAIKSDLVTPSGLAITDQGEIYITELGTGRLLRVRVNQ
jgi:hypothetical protein